MAFTMGVLPGKYIDVVACSQGGGVVADDIGTDQGEVFSRCGVNAGAADCCRHGLGGGHAIGTCGFF